MGRHARLDIAWYCDMYLAGHLLLDGLVSRTLTLDEVDEALTRLRHGGVGDDLARQVVVF